MLRRWIWLLACLVLSAPTALAAAEDGLTLTPITFKAASGQEVAAERGEFWVPEDRANPASRKIKLVFVRFAATTPNPGPPLVYLAGGPGGSGVATARGARFPIFLALRAVGDVIAFDQRGTGGSNQIPFCADPPSQGVIDVTRAGMIAFERERMTRCWAFWREKGVAIGAYDTWESAADLDDLRKVLGARRLDLWGISYGSHLGLAYVKRYPKNVARIALASLEGQDQTVKLPASVEPVLDRISAQLTPGSDLKAVMRRVHARLDAEPVQMTVAPRPGAPPVTLKFDSFLLRILAGGMIKNPDTEVFLPALYGALDKGAYDAVAPRLAGMVASSPGLGGMGEAMDLASGITSRRLALVEEQAKTATLGDALNWPMPQVLGVVDGVDLGDGFRAPLRSSTPALFISGTLDGRTPLAEQAEVVRQFKGATQIIVENAGHDVLEAHPDIPAILVGFFKGEPVKARTLTLPPMKPMGR